MAERRRPPRGSDPTGARRGTRPRGRGCQTADVAGDGGRASGGDRGSAPPNLRRRDALWTLTTAGHVVPFLAAAAVLLWLEPMLAPVAALCALHAWGIPALYAQRGANVVRARRRGAPGPERVALGLLGGLIDDDARALHARSGLVVEPGAWGTWVVGEAGALLVRGGRRRRVECWCVQVRAPELPGGDRIAHLLLALRADEAGFATVANMAFSGAPWRVRARMRASQRPALQAALR